MDTQFIVSLLIILATFALYIWIAVYNTAKQTSDFYVAGRGVPPIFNGMAIRAAVDNMLLNERRIQSHRLGLQGEGDDGVTIATLV